VTGVIEERSALEAFRCEAGELSRALSGVRGGDWARPTRCEPWSVREVLGHIRVVIGWLPQMVEGPEPDTADVSAARYYRPDDRFSPQTNATRIQLARDLAADHVDGAGFVADFASTWQQVYRQCRDESVDRVVRTRHGDAMLLSEFLVTRVVEVAVHGLDIADALDREPWLTAEAEETVLGLVIGPQYRDHMRELQWDGPTALRKVTGRAALTDVESSRIERLGATWITLG
jgi:uncharacterized protein (TIGR03083 family)